MLYQILSEKEAIAVELAASLDLATVAWGVQVERCRWLGAGVQVQVCRWSGWR